MKKQQRIDTDKHSLQKSASLKRGIKLLDEQEFDE
jgi:hypothetical protein